MCAKLHLHKKLKSVYERFVERGRERERTKERDRKIWTGCQIFVRFRCFHAGKGFEPNSNFQNKSKEGVVYMPDSIIMNQKEKRMDIGGEVFINQRKKNKANIKLKSKEAIPLEINPKREETERKVDLRYAKEAKQNWLFLEWTSSYVANRNSPSIHSSINPSVIS